MVDGDDRDWDTLPIIDVPEHFKQRLPHWNE